MCLITLCVSSTEKDIDKRLTKAWKSIEKLSIIWKSEQTDKMKRSFFQAAVVSILLYGCTTWTQTKRLEKKLDGNYTRMLRAILNKSWRQHPTKHQLYGHLPPITKTIQVRWTRHAGNCWRSRDELISDVLLWTSTYGLESRTTSSNSSYVRIRDVALKTCQRRWTIGKSGERESGISVQPARHDDDDIYIYIYIERERERWTYCTGWLLTSDQESSRDPKLNPVWTISFSLLVLEKSMYLSNSSPAMDEFYIWLWSTITFR